MENVLGESRKMITDCLKSLVAALSDLKGTLVEVESSGQKEVQRLMILGAPLQMLIRYFNLRRLAGSTGVYSL
ncbi:hypothetical protein SASPL_110904 [Salvia splendens]|uniref:Uncharacterized protein n=1 Tax=Salvia splendens TaxID=180675 RepID=A0A8X9A1X0_SALSN|nr:hypothetical protein SASPL_110904 [Salvia splendens]